MSAAIKMVWYFFPTVSGDGFFQLLVTLIPVEQEFITMTRQMNENILFIAVVLLVTGYWLLVTGCWLLVARWTLLHSDTCINSLLQMANTLLLVRYMSLLVAHC